MVAAIHSCDSPFFVFFVFRKFYHHWWCVVFCYKKTEKSYFVRVSLIYTCVFFFIFDTQQVLSAGPQHLALLPAAETPKPWDTVVAAAYANLKNVPVLFSRSFGGGRGRWVCPGEAIVVDEEKEDGGGGGEERVEQAKRLSKVSSRVYFLLYFLGVECVH